jgi:hypothetical protein
MTPTTLGNMGIKQKWSNVFSLVIETTNRNKEVMVETLDWVVNCLNITKIENKQNLIHECTFKKHIEYLKQRDKKNHKVFTWLTSFLTHPQTPWWIQRWVQRWKKRKEKELERIPWLTTLWR